MSRWPPHLEITLDCPSPWARLTSPRPPGPYHCPCLSFLHKAASGLSCSLYPVCHSGSHCLNPSPPLPGGATCLLAPLQTHLTASHTVAPAWSAFPGPLAQSRASARYTLPNALCFPLSAWLDSGRARTLRGLTLPRWCLNHAQHKVGTHLLGSLRGLKCRGQVGEGEYTSWDMAKATPTWDTRALLSHPYPHPNPTGSNHISISWLPPSPYLSSGTCSHLLLGPLPLSWSLQSLFPKQLQDLVKSHLGLRPHSQRVNLR